MMHFPFVRSITLRDKDISKISCSASHFVRQTNFETNLFDIKTHFRDSKTKSADASNFVGLAKISLDQI